MISETEEQNLDALFTGEERVDQYMHRVFSARRFAGTDLFRNRMHHARLNQETVCRNLPEKDITFLEQLDAVKTTERFS